MRIDHTHTWRIWRSSFIGVGNTTATENADPLWLHGLDAVHVARDAHHRGLHIVAHSRACRDRELSVRFALLGSTLAGVSMRLFAALSQDTPSAGCIVSADHRLHMWAHRVGSRGGDWAGAAPAEA